MADNDFLQKAGDNSEQYQALEQTITNYRIEQPDFNIRCNALKQFVEAYNKEIQQGDDSSAAEYIEKLTYFINKIEGDFETLQQKLTSAGYEKDIDLALRLKQSYSKQIQKVKHIKAGQKIHAYLLGRVLMEFHENVYKLLTAFASQEYVKEIIRGKVVIPMDQLINSEENVLEMNYEDVYAMIYYLTGNCHIKWQ